MHFFSPCPDVHPLRIRPWSYYCKVITLHIVRKIPLFTVKYCPYRKINFKYKLSSTRVAQNTGRINRFVFRFWLYSDVSIKVTHFLAILRSSFINWVIWKYEKYFTALCLCRSNKCYEHLEISRQHSDSNVLVFNSNSLCHDIAFSGQK
jgi:hypothetical protein